MQTSRNLFEGVRGAAEGGGRQYTCGDSRSPVPGYPPAPTFYFPVTTGYQMNCARSIFGEGNLLTSPVLKGKFILSRIWFMAGQRRSSVIPAKRILSATVFLLLCPLVATAGTLFESATLGKQGISSGGFCVGPTQYLGASFTVTKPVKITAIGGHLASEGKIFGAIVRLPAATGAPSFGPAEIQSNAVVNVVFQAPRESIDLMVPLSATLPPGSYGLIFGSGAFGADGTGFMPVPGDTGSAEIAAVVNYFSATVTTGSSFSRKWENGRFRGARFVVYGDPP